MSKFLYPIMRLPETKEDGNDKNVNDKKLPLYLKWWLYNRSKQVLSDVITGSNLTLPNSAKNRRFKKFIVNGATEQTQYEGRNLLPIISANSITSSGITLTSNGDGSFTANGTATQEDSITFDFEELFTLPNETLYWHIRNNSIAECSLYLEGNNISSSPSFSIANRIMTSSNLTNLSPTKFGIHFGNGITLNNIKFTPSIELTNSVTDFEPYVGGKPSPSPEYPQPIRNVVGEIKIKVQNKNLFNPNGEFENGYYNLDGTFTPHQLWKTMTLNCNEGDKFTKSGTGWGGIVTFWNNDSFVSSVNSVGVTIPAGANKVKFACQYPFNNDVQLEPRHNPNPLCTP